MISAVHLDIFFVAYRWMQLLYLEPGNVEAMLNLAQVFSDLHNFDQSLAVLQKLLEHQPDHIEALYRAGVILYRTKQYDEAVRTLSKVMKYHQGYRNTLSLLSSAEKQLNSS